MEQVERQFGWILKNIKPSLVIDLKSLFTSADSDGSETLGYDEVAKICRLLKKDISDDVLCKFFTYMDVSGDGNVSFNEFATVMIPCPPAAAAAAAAPGGGSEGSAGSGASVGAAAGGNLRRFFSLDAMIKEADGNGDGLVSYEEFKDSVFGQTLSETEARKLFIEMDADKSGDVSLKEFKVAVMTQKMFEFFDQDRSGQIDEDELLDLASINSALLDKTGVKALCRGISEDAFNKGGLSSAQFSKYLFTKAIAVG